MAMAMWWYVTAHITRWRRFRALLDATKRCHQGSIAADSCNRACMCRFFTSFSLWTHTKRSQVDAKAPVSIEVLHIKPKRRAKLRWVYSLLGGHSNKNNIWSGFAIAFVIVCELNPVLETFYRSPEKTLKWVTLKLRVFAWHWCAPHRQWYMMWEWCNAPMDAALLILEQEMNFSCDLEVSMNTYETCWSLDAHGMSENFLGWVPGWFEQMICFQSLCLAESNQTCLN